MRGAQLGELISRSLDERMLYCQCCPHRPIPAYPDVHYPFAVCDCCPRLIPKAAWRPISRRPSICSSCKRRVFEERMTGGFVGLIAGVWGSAIAVGGISVAVIGAGAAAVIVAVLLCVRRFRGWPS